MVPSVGPVPCTGETEQSELCPVDEHVLAKTTRPAPRANLIATWQQIPLYGRIVIGVVLGVAAGLALGSQAAILAMPGKLVLRLLGALAPPLILAAIVHTFMTTHLGGPLAARLRMAVVVEHVGGRLPWG
jgi:Na+/serine symporter